MARLISQLTAATTPLAGTELAWVEQGGAPRKVAVSEFGGVSDHGALTGLADDDHPQYAPKVSPIFTGSVSLDTIISRNGNYTVINAGESHVYATGQTAENVYLNAEAGLQVNSSPDNWATGWAARYTATICDGSGNSSFPGNIAVTGTVDGIDVAAFYTDMRVSGEFSATYKKNMTQYNRFGAVQDMAGTTDWDEGVYGGQGAMTNGPTGMTFDPFLVMGSSTDVRSFLVVPRTASRALAYKGSSSTGASHTAWHYSGWTTVAADAQLSLYAKLASPTFTGLPRTTGQFQAVNGLIGTYDDAASGSWGGPIWGMDDGFTGPTGGTNALATGCYGLRWNRASSTQANANIGEGVYVYQNGVLEAGMGTAGVYSAADVYVTGSIEMNSSARLLTTPTNRGTVNAGGTADNSGVGSYNGFSINNDLIFMHNGTAGGIYDEVQNRWAIRTDTNAAFVALYNTGVEEVRTLNSDAAGNTSGMEVKDHSQTYRDVGFNDLRLVADNPASVAVDETHMGGVIYADANTGFTITLPSSTSSFPIGGVITIINANTSVALTVADQASYTCFYLNGSTRTDIVGTATIAAGGVATIWRQTTGGTAAERTFLMWGSGITA